MRAFHFPDYRGDNPYQQLLAEALGALGVEVQFPYAHRRGLPLSRAISSGADNDILHLHWLNAYLIGQSLPVKIFYALRLLFDIWLVRLRGVRFVWTVHNLVSHETTTPGLELWVSRKLAKLADALIVHSEAAKLAVVEQFHARPDKVIITSHGDYGGVYGEKVPRVEARQRLGLSVQKPVFLFFGLIRPYKGVESLLRIWRENAALHDNAELIIAGDARDPELAQAIRTASSDNPNVHLRMEFVPNEEIPVYFGAADFAVFPFTKSLTSGSLALAKTYSVPVVAALTEGTGPTGSTDGSYSFQPGDEADLLSAMLAALEDFSNSRASPSIGSDETHQSGWASIGVLHKDVYKGVTAHGD